MKRIPTVLLLALVGCKSFGQQIVVPPRYDEQCVPTDDTYLQWAQETQDLAPEGEIPADPQESLNKVHAYFVEKGIKLVPKGEKDPQQWGQFTTTLPEVILLGQGWEEKSIASQAATLWHEAVHVRQWERLGPEAFFARYIVAEGRWSIEVVAYRESNRVDALYGANDEERKRRAEATMEGLYEKYYLHSMPKKCAVETGVGIILSDL